MNTPDEPGHYSTKVEQGADFERTFVMPITRAASARISLRLTSESDVVAAFSSPSDGLVVSEDGASVVWTMTAEQTAALDAGAHVWDLLVTRTDGKVKPIVTDGSLVVGRAVTRNA